MSKRLKTRVSAGAALVTGIGMMGIATATPASAEPVTGELEYTCSVPDQNIEFEEPWTVELTLPIEDQVDPGETIPAGDITASVTPGSDAVERLQSLEVTSLEGSADTTYTFGEGEERDVELTVPQTDVPTEDGASFSTEATGESTEETAPDEDGTVDIVAGDFTAALQDDDDPPFVFNIECEAPEDAKVGTVAVGDAEVPDDGDEGEDPGDGDEGEEPPAEDDGGEEPPAEDDGAGDDAGEDEGAGDDAGDDAGAGEAEVPDVVQTDGAQAASGMDTSLALGGLLLAGAGAGAVVVARRKATQH